ncbi:hypothetical protein BDB00DRAFT_877320 [Zychaea mexicana]|uniref:uncharacterized protein n=1 Tax=Zychaea mexicana TaxID=64656 RepID=UPI0022FE22D6|nr:uncharacterized protein BDB00DRAFT_877320 [Zychaea mexicana]KAI9488534.1 hypothetical protein BDB00DRAFT_877320 [Zychaea mexicana]
MYYGALVWTVIAIVLLVILALVLRWNARRKARLRQQAQVQDIELNLPDHHPTDVQQMTVPICPQHHSHIIVANNAGSDGRGHNSVHPAALHSHGAVTLPPPAYHQRNSDPPVADEALDSTHSWPPSYKDHTRDTRYL